MSAHTAGPWTDRGITDRGTIVGTEQSKPRGWTYVALVSKREDVNLIAAAPDLIAALRALMSAPAGAKAWATAYEQAATAIAKAEGKS